MAEALDLLLREAVVLGITVRTVGLLEPADLLVPLDFALDVQTLRDAEQSIGILRLAQTHVRVDEGFNGAFGVGFELELLVVELLGEGRGIAGTVSEEGTAEFEGTLLAVHELSEGEEGLADEEEGLGVVGEDALDVVDQ
jgi:hypothetical protein